MSASEIKNVLVLGNVGVDISKFARLFGAYLQHNSYKEANELQPNLYEAAPLKSPWETTKYLVGNLNLRCALNLKNSLVGEQVLTVLDDFGTEKSLTGVIILLKYDWNNAVYLKKLKDGIFSKFKEFTHNFLYVYALDAKNYNFKNFLMQEMQIFETNNKNVQEKNIFYFEEDAFYNISSNNWEQSAAFCKSINNYINSLHTFDVHAVVPKISVLNLIDNYLLELLIQIYINYSKQHNIYQISEYKRYTTVCYGNQCIQILQGVPHPKICHALCNCKSNNTANCIIFGTTPNNACIQCNCSANLHSEINFKYSNVSSYSKPYRVILLTALSYFFIFKQENQQENNFHDIILKMFDWKLHKSMYGDFKLELDEAVKQQQNSPIKEFHYTEVILKTLLALFALTDSATIIPEFLEEVFPEDFILEISENTIEFAEPNASGQDVKEAPSWDAPKMDKEIYENETLKNEIAALNRKMDQLLSLNKSMLLKQRPRDFKASASNTNLDLNKKNSEEEINADTKGK